MSRNLSMTPSGYLGYELFSRCGKTWGLSSTRTKAIVNMGDWSAWVVLESHWVLPCGTISILKKLGSWVSMAVTFSFWPLRQGTYPSHSLLKPLDYFPSIQLNMYKRTYFSESHSPVLGLKICKIWLAQPLTPVFACIVCHF